MTKRALLLSDEELDLVLEWARVAEWWWNGTTEGTTDGDWLDEDAELKSKIEEVRLR